jgi:hypothetical protein
MDFIKEKGEQKMKMILRLAVLFVSLLVISNLVFARTCDQELCYEISTTNDHGDTYEWTMEVCLNNDGTGQACGDGECGNLYLFGGGSGWFNTSGYPGFVNGSPRWTTWIFSAEEGGNIGFMNPIGEGELLTGEAVTHDTRYIINGRKVPLSNCSLP